MGTTIKKEIKEQISYTDDIREVINTFREVKKSMDTTKVNYNASTEEQLIESFLKDDNNESV